MLWRAEFDTRRARLRAAFDYLVRRYRYEMCRSCGGRVGRAFAERSYWHAPDELWLAVVGSPAGVLCPGCFTAQCEAHGIFVRWEVHRDELPA